MNKKVIKIATTVFKDTPVLFAYLYGSHATGLAHSFSDIDIGIYVPAAVTEDRLDLEMSLALSIDRVLKEKSKSDVRVINHLPLAVVGEIVTNGLLIYCRDDKVRIDYETIVRMSYFDFIPFLKKYQQEYLEQMS